MDNIGKFDKFGPSTAEMDKSFLDTLDLSPAQWEAYEILTELGRATAGRIASKSKRYRSAIYAALPRLVRKGLAGASRAGPRTYYEPAPPERLLALADERQRDFAKNRQLVQQAVGQLLVRKKQLTADPSFAMYTGVRGIRAFLDMLLGEGKKGCSIDAFGIPPEMRTMHGGYFREYHSKRIKKGIRTRLIFSKEALLLEYEEPSRLIKMRAFTGKQAFPAEVVVMQDIVGIVIPSNEPVVFMMRHAEAARSFRGYFELLWKQSLPAFQKLT